MIKRRLIGLISGGRKYIYLSVIFKWLGLLSQLAIVYSLVGIIKITVNYGLVGFNIGNYILIFIGGLILRIYADKMAVRSSYLSARDVKKVLRNKIYDKLNKLGSNYSEHLSTAELVQVSTEGVEQLEIYFGQYLPQFFYSLLAPISLFIVLSFISFKVALVLLICVPLIPLSIVMVQKFAKRLLGKYWSSYTSLGDSFLENLQGLTSLKIYKADEDRARLMDEEAANFRRITMKVLVMQLNSISVMDIVALGGAAVGMVMSAKEFMANNIDFYGALIIILLSAEFFIPMRLLGSFFHIAMNGMAASDKIFALLDIEEEDDGEKEIDPNNLDIKILGLNFSYDGKRQVLKDISMNLETRKFLALVGRSGCGKSTIAKILSGRLRAYDGEIKIGDYSLKDIRTYDLMEKVTKVSHNSYIFKGSFRDNLMMAGKNISDQEMLAALSLVNLDALVKEREGLDTPIMDQGANLSGGERQRLALARAILKDSPVYIFDEATSNIDAESESLIMSAIYKLKETKTIIFISHKLSNVIDADEIYFMEDGRVCERGRHAELIEKNGAYKEIFEHQYELENYTREVEDGK